jgi:ABC-type sugar transport system ATPase subunit
VAEPGRVEIAGAGALEYDAKAFEAAAGRESEVGVRPEDVVIADSANGSGVALQPDFAEELGPNRLLHGSVAGTSFVVSVPSSDHAAPTGGVRFSAPADKIHLFDIEKGRSLRCAS